jgi:hypothetical protein
MNGFKEAKEKKYMGKFKNYFLLIILISISSIAQNKIIVPKSGTIVFIKETKVIDAVAFKKSFNAYKPKLMKELTNQIIFEQLSDGKKIDSTKFKLSIKAIQENFIPFFEMIISESENLKIVHQYAKDTIYSHKFENGKKVSTIFFDKATAIIYNNYNQEEIKDFYNEEIIEIKEYKNQRKIIKGYDCFKVNYSYIEQAEDDYPLKIIRYKREMWVTEKIKLPFLSMIKDKRLLFDYFPLEIIEHVDGIDGLNTTYILESIVLQ